MRVTKRADPDICWCYGNLHVQKANMFKSQLPISTYSISHWHIRYLVSSFSFLHVTFYNHMHSELEKYVCCKRRDILCAYSVHWSMNFLPLVCISASWFRRHMPSMLLFAWVVCSKIPTFLPLVWCCLFYSVKGIHYCQIPRFESMMYFARVLVDFVIMACLKWKR